MAFVRRSIMATLSYYPPSDERISAWICVRHFFTLACAAPAEARVALLHLLCCQPWFLSHFSRWFALQQEEGTCHEVVVTLTTTLKPNSDFDTGLRSHLMREVRRESNRTVTYQPSIINFGSMMLIQLAVSYVLLTIMDLWKSLLVSKRCGCVSARMREHRTDHTHTHTN